MKLKEEYPYFIGRDLDNYLGRFVNEQDIISCNIYEHNQNDEERLKIKMTIDKEDLYFDYVGDIANVYSKIDIGEHAVNESSLISRWNKDSNNILAKGDKWRAVILKEL